MAEKQSCDFCGAEFEWTEEQVWLDLQLRLLGSGLGAMCDTCEDKMIEAERLAEERREWENAEMERHFREHPRG